MKNVLGEHLIVVVSTNTTRHALHNMFGVIRDVEEVFVHGQECALQLEFAQCHQDWTIHDWYEVIFSDHTKIN